MNKESCQPVRLTRSLLLSLIRAQTHKPSGCPSSCPRLLQRLMPHDPKPSPEVTLLVWPNTPRKTKILLSGITFQGLRRYPKDLRAKARPLCKQGQMLYYTRMDWRRTEVEMGRPYRKWSHSPSKSWRWLGMWWWRGRHTQGMSESFRWRFFKNKILGEFPLQQRWSVKVWIYYASWDNQINRKNIVWHIWSQRFPRPRRTSGNGWQWSQWDEK